MSLMQMYHYCTIYERLDVLHSKMRHGKVIVRFDEFISDENRKIMECEIPGYVVKRNQGFSDAEVEKLIDFCKHNAHLFLKYAKEGGVWASLK